MVCFLPETTYRVISYFVSPGMRTGLSSVASCADADEESSNANKVDSIFICAMDVLPISCQTTASTSIRVLDREHDDIRSLPQDHTRTLIILTPFDCDLMLGTDGVYAHHSS